MSNSLKCFLLYCHLSYRLIAVIFEWQRIMLVNSLSELKLNMTWNMSCFMSTSETTFFFRPSIFNFPFLFCFSVPSFQPPSSILVWKTCFSQFKQYLMNEINTLMHLEDSSYILSVHVFPGDQTHDLVVTRSCLTFFL